LRRTLLLDENDLIMVVKEDVVKQIDKNRGELNRTEFVNYLIQCQLEEQSAQEKYVKKEELEVFMRQIMELLHNFLQFFISYGMSLGKPHQNEDLQNLNEQLESFYKPDEDSDDEEEL
jgi:hypothetical protein